jgi:hypothetical protein
MQQLCGWWNIYIPPVAKCAIGVDTRLVWLANEGQRQKQIPFGHDNWNATTKSKTKVRANVTARRRQGRGQKPMATNL